MFKTKLNYYICFDLYDDSTYLFYFGALRNYFGATHNI